MKTVLMTAIMTSISEVMETMFFLPVESGLQLTFEQSGLNNEKCLACRISFAGDASGSLSLVVPEKLVVEMAENFMGEPGESLSQDHLSGTLTEMLNMVCGNALSKTQTKIPFNLSIPEIISVKQIPKADSYNVIETIGSKMAIHLELV